MVCVEITAFRSKSKANFTAGSKYPRDLPTPVPASTSSGASTWSALATAKAMLCCSARYSKSLARENNPSGANARWT